MSVGAAREPSVGAPLDFAPGLSREGARRRLARALAEAGIASADLDARLLLCAALAIDHLALVRESGVALDREDAARLERFAARRLSRAPVSRIIGAREFWGARFELSPATLDPRPDTETLVEAVLDHVGGAGNRPWRILDLGVGSGAILGALLASLPNAFGIGVDLSPDACVVAKGNLVAQGLQGRGKIVCADWASPLEGRFDFIVSNPPYIARGDIADLEPEVRVHDPRLALDGGEDGLDAYRALIPAAPALLARDGLMALELGQGQGREVGALLDEASLARRRFRLDLKGVERIILAQFT